MERLTSSKVADELRHNIAGLRAAGIEPDIDYIRYVRLAELEEAEERRELCGRESEDYYE